MRYSTPEHDHVLLSVDLGKRKVGVAAFFVPVNAPATLLGADTVVCMTRAWDPLATAAVVMNTFVGDVLSATFNPPLVGVCEWPRLYPHQRLAHKDLETLHAVGDVLGGCIGGWAAKYAPHEWKGNVPKAPHRRRIRRALSENEIETLTDLHGEWLDLPESHDMWDAVGIGLYALERCGRGGVHVPS